jgi:hypothetical protein
MTFWIVTVSTLILLFFIVWHAISRSFRERSEEPKFRFLERLGADAPRSAESTATPSAHKEKRK